MTEENYMAFYDDYYTDDAPESRRKHPALDEINTLLDDHDKMVEQRDKCIKELCTIAAELGVGPTYAAVIERIQLLVKDHYAFGRSIVEVAQRLGVEVDHTKIMERLAAQEATYLGAQRENAALRQQHAEEKTALQREVQLLRAREKELESTVARLNDENERWYGQHELAYDSYDQLNSRYELLEDRYAEVVEKRHELQTQLEQLTPKVKLNATAGALESMLNMLAMSVSDPGAAKNYVEFGFHWDEGAFPQVPFRRATVTFLRDGGLTPHERAEQAIKELDKANEKLANLERTSLPLFR